MLLTFGHGISQRVQRICFPVHKSYRLLKYCVDMVQDPLLLTAISNRIAKRFDILVSRLCSGEVHNTCTLLHHFYGAELFYCPISSCSRHGSGFEKRENREAHAAKHQRPVKCDVPGCDFSSIGFESEDDKTNHMSGCHGLALKEETIWEDMDDESCFRVLYSAARQGEFGLVQSLLSLTSQKIIDFGGFGKLLLAAEGQSADIINLVISVCKSICETTARSYLKGACDSLNKQLEEAQNNAALSVLHPSPAQPRMITPRAISNDPRLPLQRLHPDWTNNPRLHLGRCQRCLG